MNAMKTFTHIGEKFYLDGKPFTVRAGAIHYFRVPRAYWHDRLLKLKECGFNTVETYVAWNLHEPKEGAFDFSGEKDVVAFLRAAQALGLYAIVRPGPFICAEWEAGGFPTWLLADRNMRLRCSDPKYMQKVERYFARLFAVLRPCAIENGGNVLLWQVENEYGSYGNDKEYLHRLVAIYRENGINGQLFTADGAWINMLVGGALPEKCLPALTFGSRTEQSMACIDRIATVPKMCAEFWCGWFDHWGEEHHTRTTEDVLHDFEPFLANDWSFNFYMFHGGTNFAFHNGANFADGKLMPTVTSYDYCAPLNEAGDRTESYYALRETMARYGVPVPPLTAKESKKAAYGIVALDARAYLFDNLEAIGKRFVSPYALSMEEIGQNGGYILYSVQLEKGMENDRLWLDEAGDRAIVFADGEKIGVFDRNEPQPDVRIDSLENGKQLDILVENRGRVNYGREICDAKGLRAVCHGGATLFGYTIHSLEMEDLTGLVYSAAAEQTDKPVFCAATFTIDEPCDTFVELKGVRRGFVVINGLNLGRFNYDEGPQKTLYVPAPYLQKGVNKMEIFSSDGAQADVSAIFSDAPKL